MRVLAARQWLREPTAAVLSLELLAAFVQPNHPAVARVLGEVATALEKATRSGSLAVSHVSPERIDAIVAAVCQVLLDPVLARLDLQLASWTRRPFDGSEGDPQRVYQRLTSGLDADAILLMHDGYAARTPTGAAVILAVLPLPLIHI